VNISNKLIFIRNKIDLAVKNKVNIDVCFNENKIKSMIEDNDRFNFV